MSRGSRRLPVRYNHVLFVPLPGSGWFKDVTPLGHSGPSAASPSLGGCLDSGDWLELWSWESRQVCKGQPCSAVPPRRGWLCDLYEHALPYTVRSVCCTPSWNTPFLPSQKTCRYLQSYRACLMRTTTTSSYPRVADPLLYFSLFTKTRWKTCSYVSSGELLILQPASPTAGSKNPLCLKYICS